MAQKLKKYIGSVCFFVIMIASAVAAIMIFGDGNTFRDMLSKPEYPFDRDSLFRIEFIDVGQGDAILLYDPCGKYMLIDTGPKDAEKKLMRVLESEGAGALEYLVITHAHDDHAANLETVYEKCGIGKLILQSDNGELDGYTELIENIKCEGVTDVTTAKVGDCFSFGDTSVSVLSTGDDADDLNSSSIVLRVKYGKRSFLLMADAEASVEKDLVSSFFNISCDVLKVGHHGSSSATSKDFLCAVSPSAAVVSCGEDNDFGHPAKSVLERLDGISCEVFRTDTDGNVIFYTDGEKLWYGGV